MDRKLPPIVSVIIPTYNRLDLLPVTINSVLRQTFQDFEILIVDDGSTDPIHTLKALDPRIGIVRHTTNLGESSARNTGIQSASGKYIAFLDSDDEWLPDKLSVQIEWMQNHPEIKATSTGYYYLTEEGRSCDIPANRQDWFRHFAKGMDLAPGSTLVAHRNCMLEFPYDIKLPRMPDWDWAIRFSLKYSFYVIQKPLAIIHRGARPLASTVETANLMILDKHEQDFYRYGRFFGSFCVGKRFLEIAVHHFREKNRSKGFYYLWKAVKKNPFQRPGMYLRIIDYLLGTSFLVMLKRLHEQLSGRNVDHP